jgi:hypothetical protein
MKQSKINIRFIYSSFFDNLCCKVSHMHTDEGIQVQLLYFFALVGSQYSRFCNIKDIERSAFLVFFSEFEDNYVIISGTACEIHEEIYAQTPRATKVIDVILCIAGRFR